MFIRPELRKGDVERTHQGAEGSRRKARPDFACARHHASGLILFAADAYVQEQAHVAKLLAKSVESQRIRNGFATARESR